METNNYSQFIEKLHSRARSARWKMFYDKESDSLYWTKRPFPSGDKLAKVAKEISFYIDKAEGVNGLMIQPFQNNFLSHNENVAGVKRFFTNKVDDNILTIPANKRKEAEPLLATLSATIQKDIYKDVAEADYSLEDLTQFLVSSTK